MFWTGDSTAHDDPWVSITEVTDTLETIVSTVQKTFSDKMDKTFVSLGNHDSFPNGSWDFQQPYPADNVRTLLKNWVGVEQQPTYDKHGYYYKDIVELQTRVISINSESCDYRNDYLWS